MAQQRAIASEVVRILPDQPGQIFDGIAALHTAEIHHGILPLFGQAFLSRLYRQIAGAPQAGVWGLVESGHVRGFIAGCMDLRRMYRSVLLRGGLSLVAAAGRAILSPPVLRKLPSLATYFVRGTAGETEDRGVAPELLAIAVSPVAQGRGLGRMLVRSLEDGFRSWGIEGPYRVSTNLEEQASNAFYRAMDFTPCGTVRHHALTLQQYQKECG